MPTQENAPAGDEAAAQARAEKIAAAKAASAAKLAAKIAARAAAEAAESGEAVAPPAAPVSPVVAAAAVPTAAPTAASPPLDAAPLDDAAWARAEKVAAAKAASAAKLAAKIAARAAAEGESSGAVQAADTLGIPHVPGIPRAIEIKAAANGTDPVAAANGTMPAATPAEAAAVSAAAVVPRKTATAAAADVPAPVKTGYQFPPWWKDWAGLSFNDKILGFFRTAGIVVLVCVPLFLFNYHPKPDEQTIYPAEPYLNVSWTAGRWIWTLVIAILPLCIILMGFYRWRQICPLAWFGRMSEWVGYPDRRSTPAKDRKRRTVPEWLVTNYPAFTWAFLAIMLCARILLINSNSVALAWAFIGICALAAAVSFRYVGKSWCNYLCPVSTIQRIYMETDRPNYPDNSQCPNCSGCKTVPTKGRCPDINSENDYWQEVKSPSRAWAYFAWPGTVLGFYTWYFLHKPYYGHRLFPAMLNAGLTDIRNFSIIPEAHKFGVEMVQNAQGVWHTVPSPGTTGVDWAYYMSGDWTRNPEPWKEWLAPGWGFTGNLGFTGLIPTILSAPITLFLFSLVSYGLFRGAEKIWLAVLKKRGMDDDGALEAVRHSLFCIAGFTAFMLFYTFAGAPTFRQLPLQLYSLFYIGISVAATTVLFTRLRRTREKAANDKQARDWIDRWPAGVPQFSLKGKTMEESYNLITLEVRTSENGRGIFKDTVRNMLVDNALTLDEVSLLSKMAKDLGLSDSDQKKVLSELSKDLPELFDPKLKMSLGDRLRLIGYRSDLEQAMSAAGGALPGGEALRKMQEMFRVEENEHQEILRDLRNPQGTRAARLRDEVSQLFALRRKAAVLSQHTDLAICFLELELRKRIRDDRDHILEVSNLYGPADELTGLRDLIRENMSFDSRGEGEDTAAQMALNQTEAWLAAHLPTELAGDVIQAVCAAGDALPPTSTTATTLCEALLPFVTDSDPLVRGAAVHALRVPLAAGDLPDALRQTARDAAAHAAFSDSDVLVQNAGVVALAPDLWTADEFARLLQSPHFEVRRTAVNHLPFPPPVSVRPHLQAIAQSGDDSRVRVLAAALSGEMPRLPRGHLFADLTEIERIFALTNANSLLESLPREELIKLAQNADEEIFAVGETLCHEGEIEDVVYFLVDGQTEAVQTDENGVSRRLGISEAGETVGEMAVLDPAPRSASVRAINGSVRVLSVSGEAFRAVLRRDPKATLGLVRLVIRRGRQSAASRPKVVAAAPVGEVA